MFFKSHDQPIYPDLSMDVRDLSDWKIGLLREYEFALDITTVAFDPVSRILAIGTAGGVIYLQGGPGVECKLMLPEAISVKFLHFGLQSDRLVCLDEGNHLHIWDLSPIGYPKYMTMVRWDPITFTLLSPAHNHIFLALRNGELRTYDLACMRKSPYSAPNMWRQYEDQMMKAGMPSLFSQTSKRQVVEIAAHPRDLNRMFVVYEDGVVLMDLKERSTINTYELIIPPGAPSGEGYRSKNILVPRQPSLTTIAIHPAGHFFAIGYADGSIAFWAVDRPRTPLLVRTLDDLDVNIVDPDMLEAHQDIAKETEACSEREPIFKLAWSGFSNSNDHRSGETALTVLGGLYPENECGVSVLWLPPFNPGEPPMTTGSNNDSVLHPWMAEAMRDSLKEQKTFFYTTSATVQDFYLLPRNSPHFNNTYDPYAILLVVEAGGGARLLQAREFPPSTFLEVVEQVPVLPQQNEPGDATDVLADTLESLSVGDSPQVVGLPFSFLGGCDVSDGYILQTVSPEAYNELVQEIDPKNKRVRVNFDGGSAYVEASQEVRSSKYQPHRILISNHQNFTIRVHDISSQLLQTGNSPLQHHFPQSIDALEINVRSVLHIIESGDISDEVMVSRKIYSVHLALESLECAVTLDTGKVIIYRPRSDHTVHRATELKDKELQSLQHLTVGKWKRFVPYLLLAPCKRGPVRSFAMTDIGFFAASFADGSLYIIDMRGPQVIYRSKDVVDGRRRSGHSNFHHPTHSGSEVDCFVSLVWTICGVEKDSRAKIRLIATRSSGNTEVYTIDQSGSGFVVNDNVIQRKTVSGPLVTGTFVINSRTGAFCRAGRAQFSGMLRSKDQTCDHTILVTAGAKGARSFVNIDGERIGKVDWNSKYGDVIGVQIVERMGSRSLVAYTNKSSVHAYSLPHLEHIHTLPALPTPFSSISIDESGDFIAFSAHPTLCLKQSAIYGTLFKFRRAENALPTVDLVGRKGSIPSQPQPVPMGPQSTFGSWFKFAQTMSGQEIDQLLGGSDRPAPVRRARDVMLEGERDQLAVDTAASLSASASAVSSSLYNRLTTAMNERGQMLGDLEENFKSLEQGSKNMAEQAKRLAAQHSAKSWFGL